VLCSTAASPDPLYYLMLVLSSGATSPRCRFVFRPLAAVLAGACALFATGAAAQSEEPSWSQRFWRAANETTAVGVLPPSERREGWRGWFADSWEGSRRIFRDGRTDLLLPLRSFHPAYAYPNRDDQNHYPWGGGIARTWIDDRDNERFLYVLALSDSHYDFQPIAGYAWTARWPLAGGIKAGLGYTVFVTMRSDTNYFPFPAILPLASVGTDAFTLYGAWVPFSDVLLFFARASLQPAGSGPSAAPGGRRARPNLLYAAAAYVNPDAAGIQTVSLDNDGAALFGYRRFLDDHFAIELSGTRTRHHLDYAGSTIGSFEQMPIALTAQYHLTPVQGWSLYAGLGVSYTRFSEQIMPGYSLSGSSTSPAIQAGVTFALTDSLQLTGGLQATFQRAELKQGGAGLGTLTQAPVTFTFGLGWSF